MVAEVHLSGRSEERYRGFWAHGLPPPSKLGVASPRLSICIFEDAIAEETKAAGMCAVLGETVRGSRCPSRT